jgi:predicted  nucleic acid-binding Zn-ribbon protein
MFCTSCGHTFPQDSETRFCPECGYRRQTGQIGSEPTTGIAAQPSQSQQAPSATTNWQATTPPPAVAKPSGGGWRVPAVVGGVVVVGALLFGGNEVVTRQRNASATATAIANAQATQTAATQATATAVARVQATQTAVAQVTATAIANAQATATAKATERQLIMDQSRTLRGSFLSRFRTYINGRLGALQQLKNANSNMKSIVTRQSTVGYDVLNNWIARSLVPPLTTLKSLSNTFAPGTVPKPYEKQFGLIAYVLTDVEDDIISTYSALETYINSRSGNLGGIANQIDEADKLIIMGIGGAPNMLKAFENIDQGIDVDW